jgi:leader peptidase (prepilin peptidase)/N-methyltransferase
MLVSPLADAVLGGIFGLLVGSFLNVVIHRLPKMLEREWAAECAELGGSAPPEGEPVTLAQPRSRCPKCGHQIRWYENIPVLSYIALRGKCSQCGSAIGLRYPVVELATGALFFFAVRRWGVTPEAASWCLFSAALMALAFIDWDTTLLPDDITLPLLWAGLLAATLHFTPLPLAQALWGAVGGYLSLWLVYHAFRLLTGKKGMGYGDFKLFAALGAWFGWQALIPIILMASVIGAIIGIAMKFSSGLREGGYVPFGPFLATAGLTAMIFGPSSILGAIGL